MGLLDDAIRDHLELKRRHGGSSEEITKQEQEALGPVRRTAAGTEDEPVPEGAEAPAEELAGLEPADAPEGGDVEVVAEAPAADERPEEPVAPPALEEPIGPALADFGSDFDEPADPSRPVADVEQPTEEWGFDDEQERAAEAEPDEDPLEETPDFLQETPEHERLWFEQKPPKDFDFDE
jgi:hypothetical protein